MKLISKELFKSIFKRPTELIIIIFIIIILSTTYVSINTANLRIKNDYNSFIEKNNVEDFTIIISDINIKFLHGDQQYYLCKELDILSECAFTDFENNTSINNLNNILNDMLDQDINLKLKIHSYLTEYLIKTFHIELTTVFSSNIHEGDYHYTLISISDEINIPHILEGRLPIENNEIAIFKEFADANNLNINDTLIIKDKEYIITGFFYKPNFILPILDENSLEFDINKESLILMNKDEILNINIEPSILYRGKGDVSSILKEHSLHNILNPNLTSDEKNLKLIEIFFFRDLNLKITSLEKEIENITLITNSFLTLVSGISCFILGLFIVSLITSKEKQIGILRALGFKKSKIILSFLVIPTSIYLVSILVGSFIGVKASNVIYNIYKRKYFLPSLDFKISFLPFIILGVVSSISIAIIYVMISAKLKKGPIVLLSKSRYHGNKNRITKIFRIFEFITQKLNLSNNVKQKYKNRFLITNISKIIIIFITMLGVSVLMIFSLNANKMFTNFLDQSQKGNNYIYRIEYSDLKTEKDDTVDIFTKIKAYIYKINNKEIENNHRIDVFGINIDSNKKILYSKDNQINHLLEKGIIATEYTKAIYNLKIGDSVTMKIGELIVNLEIVGFSNETVENLFYFSRENLNEIYGIDNLYYNGIYTMQLPDSKSNIFRSYNYQNLLTSINSLLDLSRLILNIIVITATIISILIIYLLTYVILTNNLRDIYILNLIGYTQREIDYMILKSSRQIIFISYLLSIPLSYYIFDNIFKAIAHTLNIRLIVDFSITKLLIGFIIIFVIYELSVLLVKKTLYKYKSNIINE